MKNVVLGILLTAAAGLIGAMAGLLLAIIIIEPLKEFFDVDELGLNGAIVIALILLPTIGAIGSITLCWRQVYRRKVGLTKHRVSLKCLGCGYLLYKNTSKQCPECGRTIAPHQLDRIKQTAQRNA